MAARTDDPAGSPNMRPSIIVVNAESLRDPGLKPCLMVDACGVFVFYQFKFEELKVWVSKEGKIFDVFCVGGWRRQVLVV